MKTSRIILLAAIVLSFVYPVNIFAQKIGKQELFLLDEEIKNIGYSHVQINLKHDVSFADLVKNRASSTEKIRTVEDNVLLDLGSSIIQSATWRNQLGQIGVVASSEGLSKISKSPLIASYARDDTWATRSSIYFADNQIEKIQSKLQTESIVGIEVLINFNDVEFEIQKNGKSLLKASELNSQAIINEVTKFYESLESDQYSNLEKSRRLLEPRSLRQSLFVNQRDFLKLLARKDLRNIRLQDDPEVILLPLSKEILDHARKYEKVGVIIDLQRYMGYSPRRDVLNNAAWQSQARAIQTAFNDIFEKIGLSDRSTLQVFEGLASASVVLPRASVELLFQSRDPRIRSILINKPMAETSLLQSVPAINMTQAIAKGLNGTGQFIAVLDNGFLVTHPFFQGRMTIEACYGSTQVFENKLYEPVCPGADGAGNSIGVGTAGVLPPPDWNDHGTKMAGIIAGGGGPNGIQGVVPKSRLLGFQVFSRVKDPNVCPRHFSSCYQSFFADWTEALMRLSLLNFPELTVNMSIGSTANLYSNGGTCVDATGYAFRDAVLMLKSQKIPVISATGNSGSRTAISTPACIPEVVKVAANVDVSNAFAGFSNMANPSAYAGPFFIAPGSVIETSYTSGGYTAVNGAGTSQAAAHVSGLYAAMKQIFPNISVDAATSTLKQVGFAEVVAGFPITRVWIPNL